MNMAKYARRREARRDSCRAYAKGSGPTVEWCEKCQAQNPDFCRGCKHFVVTKTQ